MKTVNFEIRFSVEGLSCSAYFDCLLDFDTFGRMMANEGRLVKAVVDGRDVTDTFVTIIKGN